MKTKSVVAFLSLVLCCTAGNVSLRECIMRWFAASALVVVSALILPTAASGYSFGDWASDHDYSPGAVMPSEVSASYSSIDSLDGIGGFDWITTPTTWLELEHNQLSSIESGAFSGLTNLKFLSLSTNQISSIESGDFSGLTNLKELRLWRNQLSSIESGAFSGLTNLTELVMHQNLE